MKILTIVLCLVFVFIPIVFVQAQIYPANFTQVEVAAGITNPTAMAFAPDGRIFVAQQNGVLHVIKNGVKLPTPAIQLPVNSAGERGLIGIALHPSFNTNGVIYLHYTLPDGSRNRVSRFWLNGDVLNRASEQIILDLDPLSTATNHNGGAIQFKGDRLFIAVGDNGNGPASRDFESYHGKILRINANGSIPGDNPFYNVSVKARRVWSYGIRNPFNLDVEPGTGKLYFNDVGEDAWEEINDATLGGLDYGWPFYEGPGVHDTATEPVFAYPHGSGDGAGCAITGGTFFNPSTTSYPSHLHGKYFYQDFCNNWINYIDVSSGRAVRNPFATGLPGQSLGLDVGADGNLYFLSRSEGRLYKIIHNSTLNGWSSGDIGPVGIAGNAAWNAESGDLYIHASGKDIWDKSDEFHYFYRPMSGDLEIKVTVELMANTVHAWAKAGIMIRESLQPNSRNVANLITRSQGISFQRRTQPGGLTTATGSTGAIPAGLRLVRRGNTFTAYKILSGGSEEVVGSQTLTMNSNVYVGMVLTSHNNSTLSTARFGDIVLTNLTSASSMNESIVEADINASDIQLYPNPVSGNTLQLLISERILLPAKVQIINSLGQVVMEKDVNAADELRQAYEVDVENVVPGFYILRVNSANRSGKAAFLRE